MIDKNIDETIPNTAKQLSEDIALLQELVDQLLIQTSTQQKNKRYQLSSKQKKLIKYFLGDLN